MSERLWSDLQQTFMLARDKRINILSGSVRSGKTWISLLKFALFTAECPEKYEFLMVGKTLTALKRNCLGVLEDWVGDCLTYSLSKKQGLLFGRKIHFEGANDERAESKIRGMTLGGAYVDEMTQIPEDFYKMLLSRLSLPGAKLYATTNPDNPMHYVKTDIIDNKEIDVINWHFVIDDNPFLDPEYVRQIKNEYDGVFYERLILGKWVVSEGLVYPMFNREFHVVPEIPRPYERYYISMDYGTQNATAMVLWGMSNGTWYMVKEYYHSGKETNNQKTDEEYYAELAKLSGDLPVKQVIIDPSAASFITLVRRRGKFAARQADNAVLDGIRETATALKQGLIKFNRCCTNTISEFSLYSWDSKSSEDKPIKDNDHALDAVRYFVKTLGLAMPKRKSLV